MIHRLEFKIANRKIFLNLIILWLSLESNFTQRIIQN
jgi:hypothetical protein